MIHSFRYFILVCICTLFLPYTKSEKLFSSIPSINYEDWKAIEDGEIFVGWTSYNNYYWCRSQSVINHPIESVSSTLENYSSYPTVFDRVTQTKEIDRNIVHVVLNMPYPFADRDYVVEFIKRYNKKDRSIKFCSLEQDIALSVPGSVRLINAAGEWYLKDLGDDKTEITYTWNGELRGSFPSYGLTRAWRTQGMEVINWLDEYLKFKE